MTDKAKIKEIFTSIQGEGPFIGYKQLFIRFCGCNLDCQYCDTNWTVDNSKEYSIEEILDIINDNKDCHSISLTGGEPLLHSGFLKEFLPQCPIPVYLETNATLAGELGKIINYIDYVSTDIKLPSCTGRNALFNEHDDFLQTAVPKVTFAKIVFDNNITDNEIDNCCKLGAKYNIELILQPKMNGNTLELEPEFLEKTLDKFIEKYKKVRLIPQVHKFVNVR
ncbi:7-carboxy-7-deazaguanine synthase QueE [bacterium]|nr:7-carboxy-7-deazaguanine synthase QueE [bacterium]